MFVWGLTKHYCPQCANNAGRQQSVCTDTSVQMDGTHTKLRQEWWPVTYMWTNRHMCFSKKFKSWFSCVPFFTLHGRGPWWHGWLAVMKNALKTTFELLCNGLTDTCISYHAKNLHRMRLTTARRIQYLEHNIFHIRALKEYSDLDNKATNAHAWNMFYYVFDIQITVHCDIFL